MIKTIKAKFTRSNARKSSIPVHIAFLVTATALTQNLPAYCSDPADSLLKDRILNASDKTKMFIIDSLFKADEIDFELDRKILQSEWYMESCNPEHYRDLWLGKFVNAESQDKIPIIDSMISSYNINCELISDILLSDKYRTQFPSTDVFEYFRTHTVLEMYLNDETCWNDVLYRYNHSGSRSRKFVRPTEYEFRFDWQKSLASVTDRDGTKWALTYIWWYPGSRANLWLVKQEAGSDIWRGPWFTGEAGPVPDDGTQWLLRFIGNSLCIRELRNNAIRLADPEYLTRDSDRDGFYDIEETEFGTDPFNRDSDGDTLIDSEDVNPLASGIEYPSARDLAIRTIIRMYATRNYPINVYVLSGDINPNMEFFTNSPNAIFLPAKTNTRKSGAAAGSPGGLPISIKIENETDSLLVISAAADNSERPFYFKKHHRQWVVDSVGVEIHFRR